MTNLPRFFQRDDGRIIDGDADHIDPLNEEKLCELLNELNDKVDELEDELGDLKLAAKGK